MCVDTRLFFKQKTAYEMRISDWSSDVCSSDLFETLDASQPAFEARRFEDRDFARWVRTNVSPHKAPGYACVTISLKPEGAPPGDASAEQMEAIADLAERFSFDEIRVSHEQNLVLPHVRLTYLAEVWDVLAANGPGTPNAGLLSDIRSEEHTSEL